MGAPNASAADPSAAASLPPPPETRTMVKQQMESLQSYGLALYPPYLPSEKSMHYPNRTWRVALPDADEQELTLD